VNLNAELTAAIPAAPEALVPAQPAWLADVQKPRRAPLRSLVASANALFRMDETRRPEAERILADPWAEHLAEGFVLKLLRYARFVLPPLQRAVRELQTAHCVRHRSIDELTLRAIERDDYRQVVVLGAGYEMRASRFADRLDGVEWFEVDLPSMSARKRAVARRLPGTNPRVHYVPVDLGADRLSQRLVMAGFDPARPACFVLEGLIHYLKADALDALLAEIAAGPGRRRAVFSFIRSDMYFACNSSFRHLVRVLREIPKLHFTWSELSHVCGRHGLRRFEAWTYADQVRAFAPMAQGRRVVSSQDVGQVDKGT
jgi:methyltransferase (TIGR00027 family)